MRRRANRRCSMARRQRLQAERTEGLNSTWRRGSCWSVAAWSLVLQFDRALHRIDRARNFDQQAVPGRADDAAYSDARLLLHRCNTACAGIIQQDAGFIQGECPLLGNRQTSLNDGHAARNGRPSYAQFARGQANFRKGSSIVATGRFGFHH